jgi:hypothetical protein
MQQQIISTYAFTLYQAKKLTEDVPCERFAELPFEGAKHPAWVLTHLCAASSIGLSVLKAPANPDVGTPDIPQTWRDASDAAPSDQRDAYGTKAELLATLTALHDRLTKAFTAAGDDVLALDFPNPEWRGFFPTIGDAAFYMLAYHEGYHLGQMTQWRRLAGFEALND